jgi:hypothetical protein
MPSRTKTLVIPKREKITDEQLETIRTVCINNNKMDLFYQICEFLGQEDLEDYEPISSEEDDDIENEDEEEEIIEYGKTDDGFYYLV